MFWGFVFGVFWGFDGSFLGVSWLDVLGGAF